MLKPRADYLYLEPQNIYENIHVYLYQMHKKLMIVIYFSFPGLTQECIDNSF